MVKRALDAEYSVIGCMLVTPEIMGELLSITREQDFLRPELRTIYSAAAQIFLRGKKPDPVLVREAVGAEYNALMMDCMDITPSTANWREYVAIMQEQTRVAQFRALTMEFEKIDTTDDARALIARAGEILSTKNCSNVVTMEQALLTFAEEQATKREFLHWGLTKLDTQLYTDYGDFIILAGRPSAGKTALALQMAMHMGRQDNVGIYSLETGTNKLTNRMVANACTVSFSNINRRTMDEAELKRTIELRKKMLALKIDYIKASGMSVQDILATALARRHKIIFIDYLQLVHAKGKDRFEQVTNVSVALHELAQANDILVVALSQFSRPQNGRADHGPTLTDLRESGQIEQDADVVLALYENEDDDAPAGERMLRVLKNKEGTLGEFPLSFDGDLQQFCEYMPGSRTIVRAVERQKKKGAGA